MSIKNKQTYGEYYWAMQVEAQKLFAADEEAEISAYTKRIIGQVLKAEDIPDEVTEILDAIREPAAFALGAVGGRFISEVADAAVSGFTRASLKTAGYWLESYYKQTRITATVAAMLYQRKKITEPLFRERLQNAGFRDIEGDFYYESTKPFLTIPDIILWARYHGDADDTWPEVSKRFDVDEVDYPLWNWMTQQRLTIEQVTRLFKRGLSSEDDLHTQLAQIGWSKGDRKLIQELGWMIPNAMLMVQGDLLQGRSQTEILNDISLADIHPSYAQTYLDAVLTKPSSQDIVAYTLRKDPSLSDLPQRLSQIGIHPEFTDVYRELANPIPPVADIITMAVREAFSPAIAARFGQYEDFPPDFERYAAMKGLTPEWSRRYWAAHWSLPSPQQGFEMLHRGIINESELLMLLRALDIMPFWRDKLMQMSYRRLTRVDVRRMYREGVLTEREVYESYLEQGYSEQNAQRMAEFTVRQTLSALARFNTTDIVKAYTQRKISNAEARSLLDLLGVRSEDRTYILQTADYKRSWELTDERISGIRNLYKKRVYNENQARDELSRLALPAEQITAYMQQWFYEIKEIERPTWTTAQTISFAKKKVITRERAIKELEIIGYDSEHINAYMGTIV